MSSWAWSLAAPSSNGTAFEVVVDLSDFADELSSESPHEVAANAAVSTTAISTMAPHHRLRVFEARHPGPSAGRRRPARGTLPERSGDADGGAPRPLWAQRGQGSC